MKRYINLMDEKGRDAKLLFAGKPKTKNVFYVTAKGSKTESTRVLKTTLAGCYDGMLASYGSNEKIVEALISDNPEVDLKRTGMKISGTSRLYINNKLKPAFRVSIREIIRNTQGEKMEDPFYYRIHSPVILIEFDHQTPVAIWDRSKPRPGPVKTHIHTVVRTPNGNDYGKDLLREHLEEKHRE